MLELTDDPWPAGAVPNLGTWRTDDDYPLDVSIVAVYNLGPSNPKYTQLTDCERILGAEMKPICWYPLPPVPEAGKGGGVMPSIRRPRHKKPLREPEYHRDCGNLLCPYRNNDTTSVYSCSNAGTCPDWTWHEPKDKGEDYD